MSEPARKSTRPPKPKPISGATSAPPATARPKKQPQALKKASRRAHNPDQPAAAAPTQPLTPWQQWSANAECAIAELCDHIVVGGHLAEFCSGRGIPYTNMLRWIMADHARSELYARAREDRSDRLADEIVAISDDSKSDTYIDPVTGQERVDQEVVARARLRVDARKWVAAKLKPRLYGDKVAVGGDPDAPPIEHSLAVRFVESGK